MTDLPAPDALDGAPHPRDTQQIYGHAQAEQEFLQAFSSGRLHSGWIIAGPKGIGKATLAYRIAGFLLADGAAGPSLLGGPPDTLETDRSSSDWHQIHAGAHPRLFTLVRGPNQTGTALSEVITVGQVRELKKFFHMSATDGGRRVVIVDAADELNNAAANALLKELEEPPARTTILLIAHQPSRLLPTIRSRCRSLRLGPLSPPDLAHALEQAGFPAQNGAMLAALSEGSVGAAITLMQMDGAALYADLLALFGDGRMDRERAVKLADSMAGRGTDARFKLGVTLIATLAARAARAGLQGPPAIEAAPDEAQTLARIAPDNRAARAWAEAATDVPHRLAQGRAVNVDSGALFLDALLRLEPLSHHG